jgi:hypothetical protein
MLSEASLTLRTSISHHFNGRLFFLLWGIASFGLIAILPYDISLQKNSPQFTHLSLPLPVILLIQVGIQILILGLLTGVGLWLAEPLDLGAPKLESWLEGKISIRDYYSSIILIVLIGLAVSALVFFVDIAILNPMIRGSLQSSGLKLTSIATPPIWEGLLASFYGGFTEEILLRLFLMTSLAWVGKKLFNRRNRLPTGGVMWISNLLAALVFGLSHLPSAISIGLPMTSLVIARILILNGLPGVVYGWLYWKQGLGSAMLAHLSSDILLHVIAPLLILA